MGNEASPHRRIDNLKKAPGKPQLAPRELTLKQALFCLEYIANNGNGTEAAKKAGYAESSAHTTATDLLQSPAIQARLRSIQKNRMAKLEADPDWIIKELKLTVKQARKAGDNAGVNRALELLGRAQGMFSDAANARVDAQITVNLKMPAKQPIDQAQLVEIDPDDAQD